MRWLRAIIIVMVMASIMLTDGTKQITDKGANMYADYEEPSAKLRKLVDTHRLFHKEIKITFAGLVDELKPYLESNDISELNDIIGTMLDQYNDDINKADEALIANNIKLANDFLIKVAKKLENIYIAQEMIVNFKQEIAPQTAPIPGQKNKIIAQYSSPRDIPWGCFLIV